MYYPLQNAGNVDSVEFSKQKKTFISEAHKKFAHQFHILILKYLQLKLLVFQFKRL